MPAAPRPRARHHGSSASLGRALTAALVAPPIAAFGHVNWPVLLRAATVALQVGAHARARRITVRSWVDLIAAVAAPWPLGTAEALDRTPAQATSTP